MADVWGRLSGRAGVCLGTLGPGATNLTTGVGDANLDRAPVVAITGQAGRDRIHKESHQYVDVVDMFRPITKWNARLEIARRHPRGRAQGVQGGRDREARRLSPRAARGRGRRAVPGGHGTPLSTERPRRPSPDRHAAAARRRS